MGSWQGQTKTKARDLDQEIRAGKSILDARQGGMTKLPGTRSDALAGYLNRNELSAWIEAARFQADATSSVVVTVWRDLRGVGVGGIRRPSPRRSCRSRWRWSPPYSVGRPQCVATGRRAPKFGHRKACAVRSMEYLHSTRGMRYNAGHRTHVKPQAEAPSIPGHLSRLSLTVGSGLPLIGCDLVCRELSPPKFSGGLPPILPP